MFSHHLKRETVVSIINIIGELNQLQDVDMILSSTLCEARALARADAGSIFLMRNSRLEFRHVQNDTIFGAKGAGVFQYSDESLPVNDSSIVGYAALTKEMVSIDDAYAIDEKLPCRFNPSIDEKNGYRTVSILAVPLISRNHSLVGVMQLINAKDRHGRTVAFSEQCRTLVPIFTNNAAAIIERGILNRELILRMAKMAELHDPEETGAHVQRVSAISAEIYQRWAEKRQLPRWEIRRFRDIISQASMLHDAGKVGIPDAVLKKPGPLNDEEFALVKQHTVYGARLFTSISSELDQVTHDIMRHHHERWNGSGYPDRLTGEAIPLAARITALADVFDALSSQRCYKRAWAAAAIHDEIRAKSGKDFDPELVETFFQITDTLQAIQQKFV
uniref:GAF and HD-GYP domain-containing protein n=1 Tax=Candidatus Electronema sp. TaxID=2698783 RepID=UPI004056EF1F